MGSNYPPQNQIPEDLSQFLNSAIPSQNGGSSMWENLPHSAVQMQQQDAQCGPGDSMSFCMQGNTAHSRASLNSSFFGDYYLPSNGDTGTGSLPTNYDHFSAQQQPFQEGQTYPRWSGIQGDQLPNMSFTPQLKDPVHQAYSLQQPSPIQVPMQLNSCNPLAAARFFQERRIQNQLQNQAPVFVPSPRRRQLQRKPPPQPAAYAQEVSAALSAMSGSLCYRRLLYYMHHQNNRPADNNIRYWKNFVELYYSPTAMKRWCLSNYDNVGKHAVGRFNQAIADSWQCKFCGSKLEKGFVASYGYLPWLYQKNFEGGVIEQLLYLEPPIEKMLPSGSTVLWFEKAVQQSIYEKSRVVHEGQLRIVFTPQLKIISWEFCIQGHEDLIPRREIVDQVSNLVAYAENCRHSNTKGVKAKDHLSMLVTAGNNILQSVIPSPADNLGFSKPFAGFMQMSDNLTCTKEVMTESQTNNSSPIEGVKRYSQQETASAQQRQMQGMSNGGSSYQVVNTVLHTPDAREQTPTPPTATPTPMPMSMYHPSNYNQQQQQEAMANTPCCPSSCMQLPPIGHQINDLLAYLRVEGTPEECCADTTSAGQSSLVYDPVVDDPEFGEYVNTSQSKLLNYSSGSNSSAMVLADSDDNSTSRAQ